MTSPIDLSPEALEALAARVGNMRVDLLCGNGFDDATLAPMTEQYVLLALDSLSVAQRYLQLARYHFMQGR